LSIKTGLVLWIVCGVSVSLPSHADDAGESFAARHNVIWEHTTQGTFEVMDGDLLVVARTQATLEACQLEGLAKAIEPSEDLIMDKVVQYTRKSEEASAVGLELLASIKSSMLYFKFGYRDAMIVVLDTVDTPTKSGMCKAVTNQANKLLANKKK
jgi:hypothetical protein